MKTKLKMEPPGQWRKAKCKSFPIDPENDIFFSEEDEEIHEATAFCNGTYDGIVCPIREECLLFALTNNCREGVWGGISEEGRKAIRKRYPPKKGALPRDEWNIWQTERELKKQTAEGE